jgi:FkbM family methyltransferase
MLSVRKRRYIRRQLGYLTNPIARRSRVLLHREQLLPVGEHEIVLPPAHDLAFYQRRDPTYDAYAIDVLADLSRGLSSVLVVDVGANVGDTAVACLAAAPVIDVIAVEGDPDFVAYLRRNAAPFADRVRIVEGFVGPVRGQGRYSRTGTTGGFQGDHRDSPQQVGNWISPVALLEGSQSYDHVVWKSDIDGFDIHVLVASWDLINEACDTLWFEYDPLATLGDRADVDRLILQLAESARQVTVYDNLGRPLVELTPGAATEVGLRSLTAWLGAQQYGHVTVPYLDIWARRSR